jgi:hypothetical protein
MAQVLITLVRWMPNVVLCALAILVAQDKLHFLTDRAVGLFKTRFKAAAAGILLVLVSYGIYGHVASMSTSGLVGFLLFSGFWPLTAVALIAWLTPSAQRRADNSTWAPP